MKRLSVTIALGISSLMSGIANAAMTPEQCTQIFEQQSPSLVVTADQIEKGRYLIQDFAPGYPASLDAWHQCASEGISGYLGKPVVVIQKPDRNSIRLKDGRAHTSAHDTIDALSVGRIMLVNSHPLSSFVNGSRHELEAEQRWLAGMQGALKDRSSSTHFLNGCLIQYDRSRPFADYLTESIPADLASRLTEDDWMWMKAHGDSVELWHEIGHCATLVSESASIQPDANDMALSSLSKNVHSGQSCDAEMLSAGWENENDRLLWGAIQNEYQADRYALQKLGLTDNSKSWLKFRVITAIQRPQIEYMTWLGDLNGNKAQVMADSWAAINQLHKARRPASEPAQNVWARLREAGQISAIVQPSIPPNGKAVSEWTTFLGQQDLQIFPAASLTTR